MKAPRVLAFVMAGGKGERLFPLTRDRGKPAVPFGGAHRIVDFVLSNLVNSGILSIYVLVQYKSQSLIEHLRSGWRQAGLVPDHFVAVVPPQMRFVAEVWYRGTADAVAQNLNLVSDFDADLVAIFGSDHVYRADLRAVLDFHREREADATVLAVPAPIEEAKGLGVIEVDAEARVRGFEEKPARPKSLPDDPARVFGSTGNYLFDRRLLESVLFEDLRRSTAHDFGRTILPDLVDRARLFAYDLSTNEVPGTKPTEERGYWRDVGTIPAYFAAHLDLLGKEPRFDLRDRLWPIHGVPEAEGPARVHGGEVRDALLCEGTVLEEARVVRSVLGRGVEVEPGAEIVESIVMDYTRVGRKARLLRAIVDRHNRIEDEAAVGGDPDRDRRRGWHVDPSGLTVVPRGPTRRP